MTKQRYFSNFEKCLSIFGHRLECTKPESSLLENIGVDLGLRLPDCDTGCRRTEAVSDYRHKTV